MKLRPHTFAALLLSVILCIGLPALAQSGRSTQIETINGKKYYLHKVEKGQSLYAISKLYQVEDRLILAENPELANGLKTGQEIRIPMAGGANATASPVKTVTASANPGPIDSSRYMFHRVGKGETLYAVSKAYNLSQDKLLQWNPSAKAGLKEGQQLIVGERAGSSKPNPTKLQKKDTVYHKVAPGETLYSLARKYAVKVEDIQELNPDTKQGGLHEGQTLRIYTSVKMAQENMLLATPSTTLVLADTNLAAAKPKKNAYTIGLLVPFKLRESEDISVDDLVHAGLPFPQIQSLSVDFYMGFKRALDSLKSKDFDLHLQLYDFDDKDPAKIEAFCKSNEFKKLDMVIGPFYTSDFKMVSEYAHQAGIPAVSPYAQQNKVLFNNPWSSKVSPSNFTLLEGLAEFCADSLSTGNIVIVNTGLLKKDEQYLTAFKDHYNQYLTARGRPQKDTLREVNGLTGAKSAIGPGKNVVILLTSNEVYLTDFITQLSVFSDRKDVTLVGLQSVTAMDNIDQEYLNRLQFHFASSSCIDYSDSLTLKLSRDYQQRMNTDPSDYYFEGYDIAWYYLNLLKNQGPSSFTQLDRFPKKGLATRFNFFHPDANTGFENKAVFIYGYEDYKVVMSKW